MINTNTEVSLFQVKAENIIRDFYVVSCMKYGFHEIVFQEIIMKFIVVSSSYTGYAQISLRYNLEIRSPACVRYRPDTGQL